MVQGILAGHAMEAVSKEMFNGQSGRATPSARPWRGSGRTPTSRRRPDALLGICCAA